MKLRIFLMLIATVFCLSAKASPTPANSLGLFPQPGFFRFSYDNMAIPNQNQRLGLLGANYLVDLNPYMYGGLGAHGAVTGKQGGLFTLGLEGGLHHELFSHIWGDLGLYAGGGGGRSSLVGGGLMVRPHAGLQYDFHWVRLGVHYSYIDFPSGKIRSSQVGLDLDIPYEFYYVNYLGTGQSCFNRLCLFDSKFLDFQRNDFGIFLQMYKQKSGTKNVDGVIQDGTMSLVGAELDHYFTQSIFGSLRADGAFHGVPNGYMDVLAGVGYHAELGHGFALVPQLAAGAGGGGNVDTGGGILIHPQLGFEWPMGCQFSGRINGGYIWAPQGQLRAPTAMAELLYHLDLATAKSTPSCVHFDWLRTQDWRIHIFNQTYLRPERTSETTRSPDNLIGVQIDQIFTPNFFFSYQGASAYAGVHAGGFATGMIGPGLQTAAFCNNRLQPYAELLIGAGGGGGLTIGGGSIIEPVVGVHYYLTPSLGLQASVGEVKALQNSFNSPVVNVGLTIRFGTAGRAN